MSIDVNIELGCITNVGANITRTTSDTLKTSIRVGSVCFVDHALAIIQRSINYII